MASSVEAELKQFNTATNEFATYLNQLIPHLQADKYLKKFTEDVLKICLQHQRNQLKV